MSESRDNRLDDYRDDARRGEALASMSGTDFEHHDPNTDDLVPAEGQRSPREDIMARIAANAQIQREKEMEQAGIYDAEAREAGLAFPEDEPEQPAQPAQQTASEPPQPAAQPASAPVPTQPPVAPQPRTILIGGQQYAITPEQETQLIQLGMLTNQALHQYQQQPPPAPEPPRPIVDEDEVREVARKIQYGGEDDATAALLGLIRGVVERVPKAPPPDENAIVSRAVQESRAQQQLASDAAVIRSEYEDIFAHPQREFLAKINVDAIRARDAAIGQRRPDLEIYREAGDMVREAMNLPRPGNPDSNPALQAASPNVVPIRADVIERKRAAPRATQAIGLRAPAPVAPRPPTGSELVEQMRRQRGQSPMR